MSEQNWRDAEQRLMERVSIEERVSQLERWRLALVLVVTVQVFVVIFMAVAVRNLQDRVPSTPASAGSGKP